MNAVEIFKQKNFKENYLEDKIDIIIMDCIMPI